MSAHYAYERIAEDIREKIRKGELRPGDKLPSARELREQYGVSAMTVRTAMVVLRTEGLVEPASGIGVFVREQPTK